MTQNHHSALPPTIRQQASIWQDQQSRLLLMFWVFLSLSDHAKTVGQLQTHLAELTASQLQPREASLYRSLRRWQAAGLVQHQLIRNHVGPAYKQYALTPNGRLLLREFIGQNMLALFSIPVRQLIEAVRRSQP